MQFLSDQLLIQSEYLQDIYSLWKYSLAINQGNTFYLIPSLRARVKIVTLCISFVSRIWLVFGSKEKFKIHQRMNQDSRKNNEITLIWSWYKVHRWIQTVFKAPELDSDGLLFFLILLILQWICWIKLMRIFPHLLGSSRN